MTSTCQTHCYAVRYGQYRTSAQAKYQRNLELSRLPDFGQRMRYSILHHEAKVVRIHTGGDFYSVPYVRQWLRVIKWLPEVRFFTYTRSWRLPKLKSVIDRFREDEIGHKNTAIAQGARDAPGYAVLSAVIKFGCRAAIRISEKI